jgi:hypothetical protein
LKRLFDAENSWLITFDKLLEVIVVVLPACLSKAEFVTRTLTPLCGDISGAPPVNFQI